MKWKAICSFAVTLSLVPVFAAAQGDGTIVAAGNVEAQLQLVSHVATGMAPLEVSSTTRVENLNADLLDGVEGSEIGVSPWFECGKLADFSTCALPSYSPAEYRYGMWFLQLQEVICTLWNRGMRVYNRQPIMTFADDPLSGMRYGGFVFYSGTDSTDDDCTNDEWRHHYWQLDFTASPTNVVMTATNGCLDEPIYCQRY